MSLRERELQLDVVRGLAIVLAVGWHFNAYVGHPLFDALMWPGRAFGWAGVDLFFVLSGFLVGGLVLREIEGSGGFDYPRFLIRRIFRLWPVLYLYIAAQLVAGNKPWDSYFFQTLFHVQNYFPTPLAGLWSLAVEEHFYLAVGLLLPMLARRDAPPRVYVLGLLGIIITALALRCLAAMLSVDRHAIQIETHFRADALACGVLLTVASVHYPALFERLLRYRSAWLVIAVTGFVLLVPMELSRWRDTIGYTVAYLASAALILSIHRLELPRWSLPAAKVMAFLGLYSYSLYIWHFPVGMMAADKIGAMLGIESTAALISLKYAAAVIGAYVVTKLVERPMIALRDRLFPSARAVTARERFLDEQAVAPRAG